ncbi:MAG: hypothetical protein GX442_06135 [Candidatus Riflebacteria bacterium]|nr:hypothetical protein [Candidatus Riflebacteria bacterium]
MIDLLWSALLRAVEVGAFPVLDLVLAWTAWLPPAAAIAGMGLLSGLLTVACRHAFADVDLLARARRDLDLLGRRQAAAGGASPAERDRLRALADRIGALYAWELARPSLWTIPVILLFAFWMSQRLAWEPLRPGQTFTLTARFGDLAEGIAHLVPHPGVRCDSGWIARVAAVEPYGTTSETDASAPLAGLLPPTSPAAAPTRAAPAAAPTSSLPDPAHPQPRDGVEARWTLTLLGSGPVALRLRHGGKTTTFSLPVQSQWSQPVITDISFTAPAGRQHARLRGVSLGLRPALAPAWWNLTLGWAGLYLLSALTCALLTRNW